MPVDSYTQRESLGIGLRGGAKMVRIFGRVMRDKARHCISSAL